MSHTGSLKSGIAAVLAAALTLGAPAAASASRMSMYLLHGHVELHYFADAGESNALTVTSYAAGNQYCGRPNPSGPQTPGEACYFIKDPGAVGHINAGGSCVSLDPTYPGQAECFIGKLGFRDDSKAYIYVKLGDGNDTASLGTAAAQAVIDAGAGEDSVDAGGAARAEVLGGPGNDTINARAATDVLEGGDGNDTFNEPCTFDPRVRAHINGGPGSDTVSFACVSRGQAIDLRTDPRLANLENVIGTAEGDVIHGANRSGSLAGGAGHDTIFGGSGDDSITDTGGNGTYHGGGGNDTITAGGALYGGPGDDRLVCTGWTVATPEFVTEESCLLSDGPGDDRVEGADTSGAPPSAGDGDFVIAGTGRDTYDLRGGPLAGTGFYCEDLFGSCSPVTLRPDTVSYGARTHPIHASLDGHADDGQAGENDDIVAAGEIIGGSGDDVLAGSSTRATTLIGGKRDDTLRGGDRGDLLRGGPGRDRLFGGAGDDQLAGGPGADSLACGDGKDQAGDRTRGERATGCEVFDPLPAYPRG